MLHGDECQSVFQKWRYFNPESNILDFYCEGTFLLVSPEVTLWPGVVTFDLSILIADF